MKPFLFRPQFLLILPILSLLCLASLCLCVQGTALARDIYVHNTQGNDDFSGLNEKSPGENGPVRTIRRALLLADRGDRIILVNSGEPYRESVLLMGRRHSGLPGFPFTIEGNGAVLDGSTPVPPTWWKQAGDGIFRFQPEYTSFQNLYKDGVPLERVSTEGMATNDGAPLIKLEEMQWCLYDRSIYFKPQRGWMPYEYNISCAGAQHGIALFQVDNVEIRNLIVQGFQNDGIIASNMARDVYLRNVTLRGNARAGLCVGTGSTVWLLDSLLGNNLYAQALTEENSFLSVWRSSLISNTAPGWVDDAIEEENGGKSSAVFFRDGKKLEGGLNEPLPPEDTTAKTPEKDAPEQDAPEKDNAESDDSPFDSPLDINDEGEETEGEKSEEEIDFPVDGGEFGIDFGSEDEEPEPKDDEGGFDFEM
ncbi:MAG: right-handed parallel beta-helix repeat-containing protein [Planctomycetia bacterium]|nr:right-handed parallel beta-helix repeat-containing protein [Planctomycetia bacterium]